MIKIKIKKKIKKVEQVDYDPFNINTPGEFIQAAHAEIGELYLNFSGNNCVVITGKKTNESVDVRRWEVTYEAHVVDDDSRNGVREFNGVLPGHTPLLPYKNYISLGGDIMAKKIKVKVNGAGAKSVEIKKTVSGAKVKAGKALAAKAKEGIDPKIGSKPGTDAYEVGKIMLSFKPGADHRKKSMEKIVAFLEGTGRFDEKKAKTLGASWYSTLVNRKADIYGKFKSK